MRRETRFVERNLVYVLLGRFHTACLEARFGQYKQLAGGSMMFLFANSASVKRRYGIHLFKYRTEQLCFMKNDANFSSKLAQPRMLQTFH